MEMAMNDKFNGVSYNNNNNCMNNECGGFVNGSSLLLTYKRRKVHRNCDPEVVNLVNVLSASSASSGNKEVANNFCDESDFQRDVMLNGDPTSVEGPSSVITGILTDESACSTNSELCKHAFSKLLMSGSFALLRKLLSENFGLKVDKVLNFNLINSRMTDGTYEKTPILFLSDIEELWGRLNSIGQEMVSLSNNLLDLSKIFCHELIGGAEADTSNDRKSEAPGTDCKSQLEFEGPNASLLRICKQCRERSDERDSLVCDSCEAVFHISCVQPAVKEIPRGSWYCVGCSTGDVESAHEDCVICDRLNANSRVNDGLNSITNSVGICCTQASATDSDASLLRICKQCGERSDERDSLVCDSCEAIFHVSCIKPAVEEIPYNGWYCVGCTSGGSDPPLKIVSSTIDQRPSRVNDGVNSAPIYNKKLNEEEHSETVS